MSDPSEIMRGIPESLLPELQGYVCTSPKPRAEMPLLSHQGDPILAQWHYGLGRVIAFTSDAKPKWASKWIAWDRWNSFWGQAAKWALRRIETSSYDANLQIQAGGGRILVDAVDNQGKFLNQLDLQASITLPQGKTVDVKLRQTEPGHYEADFAAPEIGVYMANIRTMSNGVLQASQAIGAAISYSAEYRDTKPNLHLLQKITEVSGGRMLRSTDDLFGYKRVPVFRPAPVWNWLLAFAILLFPFDVGIRRVMIDREQWKDFLRKAMAKIGWDRWQKKHPQADEAMSALLSRKAKLRERIQAVQPAREVIAPEVAVTETEVFTPESSRASTETAQPQKPEPSKPAATSADYTAKLLEAKRRARKEKDPPHP